MFFKNLNPLSRLKHLSTFEITIQNLSKIPQMIKTVITIAILVELIFLFQPIVGKNIIHTIETRQTISQLVMRSLLSLAMIAIGHMLDHFYSILLGKLGMQIYINAYQDYKQILLKLPYQTSLTEEVGSLLSRIERAANAQAQIVISSLQVAFHGIFKLLVVVTIILFYFPFLSILVVVF